jgi:hypothetical protein
MRHRLIALVAAVLAMSACSAADPVSPLPIEVPTALSSAPTVLPSSAAISAKPSKPVATSRRPTGTVRTTTKATDRPASCHGAVRYDIELAHEELLPRSLCFAPGAVLRLIGIGPGEVSVDRPALVSQNYEAGVVDIRFLRAGTVAVTIPRSSEPETISVVIR